MAVGRLEGMEVYEDLEDLDAAACPTPGDPMYGGSSRYPPGGMPTPSQAYGTGGGLGFQDWFGTAEPPRPYSSRRYGS